MKPSAIPVDAIGPVPKSMDDHDLVRAVIACAAEDEVPGRDGRWLRGVPEGGAI